MVLSSVVLAGSLGPAAAATFHVNDTGDFIDTDLGDGLCTTGVNTCSLRAAVMQANATPGEDTIVLQPGQIYPLVVNEPGDEDSAVEDDLDISSKIFIDGNGGTIQVGPVGVPLPTCNLNGSEELAWEFRVFHVLPAGELVLDSVTIRNGCADGSGTTADGGGIRNEGKLTIRNSTVTANRAGYRGGGIHSAGTATILNTTISGNHGYAGGAMSVGDVKLSFVTIAGNSASAQAGGILVFSRLEALRVKHSIVGNNTANSWGGNCGFLLSESLTTVEGTNLDTDGTCVRFTTTSQLNLGPLANNGGLTETHALLPGSAAIDAATDCTDLDGATVPQDQRGVTRPQAGNENAPAKCDVGAYEWARNMPTPTPTNTHTPVDGCVPLFFGDPSCQLPTPTPTNTHTPVVTPSPSATPTATLPPSATPAQLPSHTPAGPTARCPAEPQAGCDPPRRSKLVIRKWPLEAQDIVELLLWRGRPRRDPSAFGNPLANTNTLICVYDRTGLVLELVVPPRAFWSRVGQRGFAYEDPAGSVGGVQRLSLERRAGWLAQHETTIHLEAAGAGVTLPLAEPVTVQVRNDTTAVCFGDTFAGGQIQTNASLLFRGIRR